MFDFREELKYMLIPVATIGLFIAFFAMAWTPNKTPVTAAQVTEMIRSEEHVPVDVTEDYRAQWDTADLIGAVEYYAADVHFMFFEFDNKSTAQGLRSGIDSFIRSYIQADENVSESTESDANYSIHIYTTDQTYAANVQVENTNVCITGDRASASEIRGLLVQMGYLTEPKTPSHIGLPSFFNETGIVLTVVFFALFVLHKMLSRPFLNYVCDSAETSYAEWAVERQAQRMEESPRVPIRYWLIEKSQNWERTHKLFLIYRLLSAPALLCVIPALVGCFRPALDPFLNHAAMVMIEWSFVVAVVSVLANAKTK